MTTTSQSAALATTVLGSGPALLLAHGAGGGIQANYGAAMAEWARRHTVIGPDYPGAGATPRSAAPLELDDLADRLVDSAVRAGAERFALHGYSLGSAVAVRAAVRHPERVTALVLAAGFARAEPGFRALLSAWHAEARAAGPAADPPGTADHVDLCLRVDTRADLPRVAVPTLVIATTQDDLVAPSHSAVLAEGIPHARRADLASGHLIWEDAPREWARLVAGFLAEHPGEAA
ncbi:alpha/beta fold hydrolase [Streptomonospora nanhaiensis]|uniref:Pimeloyl-ACP methyl ester carboxylesterase n=1 Tax=Streptomonospora nanhaiensis TaxID=1323731 RepID=A0A853BQK6_9ACTN|nr:alpha/beta fold hydrolase [Streptomonospora nanhaiensis]MBV2364003.1 alpha/beta fold hydrolase [Streptomonospora nanhaiensis]MBX9387347.1 alpha/beta fold hydrolase [Streptomonospora nanhaiensis]NYI97005.1 pimeloyl-ACP methyl ester carboxylesterase [Streptomonospora nanhaiensis]